ncbi:TatD family hydrolase [uncultured Bacteroides sp.]|uniref:TatD family hydrolase n=1 Tax=uncultured Bacteroides sp. TaxID=162156 RepID=UPI00262E7284|nr:TatD family hydrolase [uncultured Bacteroides sp.]
MINLIDTHTHLFVEEFNEDRELAVIRAGEAGVKRLFMPNVDETTVGPMLALCNKYEFCYPMIGFHPTEVDGSWKERLASVEKWLHSGQRFYGIGEVGMDLYWDKTYKNEQMEVFDIQIRWALENNLPLIVHCREAYPELLEVLSAYRQTALTGIFHSFTGTPEEAGKLLDYEGFMLGINGVVTFRKSTLPETLKNVPLERIVIETDSPYLAPVPYRGKRNESAFLVKVAEKLSEIYDVPMEIIGRKTTENALKVFKIA